MIPDRPWSCVRWYLVDLSHQGLFRRHSVTESKVLGDTPSTCLTEKFLSYIASVANLVCSPYPSRCFRCVIWTGLFIGPFNDPCWFSSFQYGIHLFSKNIGLQAIHKTFCNFFFRKPMRSSSNIDLKFKVFNILHVGWEGKVRLFHLGVIDHKAPFSAWVCLMDVINSSRAHSISSSSSISSSLQRISRCSSIKNLMMNHRFNQQRTINQVTRI